MASVMLAKWNRDHVSALYTEHNGVALVAISEMVARWGHYFFRHDDIRQMMYTQAERQDTHSVSSRRYEQKCLLASLYIATFTVTRFVLTPDTCKNIHAYANSDQSRPNVRCRRYALQLKSASTFCWLSICQLVCLSVYMCTHVRAQVRVEIICMFETYFMVLLLK